MTARVLIAAVAGPFGVAGLVKLKTFTEDPAAVASYGPLESEDGTRRFDVKITQKPKDGFVIARLSGVTDRTAVEGLKSLRLYVPRTALPETEEDEFYLTDLVGLDAVDPAGKRIGKVSAVQNFGAGDVLEVKSEEGPPQLFAFTRDVVPIVDIEGRKVVIDPPVEIEP